MRKLTSILLCLLATALTASAATDQKPNIVVILADDLGCGDLSLYDGWVQTPRIDRMAREGMMFTDFHSNSSVCSPTRTAFLTGRYQQRLGIVDVIVDDKEDRGILPSSPTISSVFKQSGYQTALFGKWHCGYADKYNPIQNGFDEFVGYLGGGSDYHNHGGWRDGVQRKDAPGYSTHVITEHSIDFIKRHKTKPFFLYISHAAVHNPYQTPQDTPDKRDKNLNQNQNSAANREKYKVMLAELDKGVGQVLDTLAEQGLAENTLVFFFSDNGDVGMNQQTRPYRGGKFSHFEGGHRVPAVAWWPGKIEGGKKSAALLAGFDLFPTFTEIAGIPQHNPANLDGASFKKLLFEKKDEFPERDIFFGYEPKLGTAMRRGPWKMIIKEEDIQLYNLQDDLKETTNLAKQQPDRVNEMRAAIEQFKKTVTPGS